MIFPAAASSWVHSNLRGHSYHNFIRDYTIFKPYHLSVKGGYKRQSVTFVLLRLVTPRTTN